MTNTLITDGAAAYLTGEMNATFTLDTYVGEYADDYDLDAANAAYRADVAALLATVRPTWTIAGDSIYSPVADADDLTDDEAADLRDAIAGIPVDAILAQHGH